jgi:hypothetical protein
VNVDRNSVRKETTVEDQDRQAPDEEVEVEAHAHDIADVADVADVARQEDDVEAHSLRDVNDVADVADVARDDDRDVSDVN